jgi:hypothetical protein
VAVQTQVVNLYSVFQALDIMAIKETLLTELKLGKMVQDYIPGRTLDKTRRQLGTTAVSLPEMTQQPSYVAHLAYRVFCG